MNDKELQNLNKELNKLEKFSGIIGIAIVNRNGLLISSHLPRDIDDRKFATMAAIMYESIETAVSSLNGDKIIHLTVEFDEYQLLVIEVDENIVLVSLMDLNINLGLMLIEIEESIKKINKFGR